MDDNTKYDDAIGIISIVESSGQGNSVVILKMKDVLANKVLVKQFSDKEARAAVEEAETLAPTSPADEAKQSKPERQRGFGIEAEIKGLVKQIHMPTVNVKQAMPQKKLTAQTTAAPISEASKKHAKAAPAKAPVVTGMLKQQPAASVTSDAARAAAEMKSAMSGRAAARKEAEAPPPTPAREMVMPTLSIPDQIAELDRIMQGLDENVFSEEQLRLVKMEVKALMESSKNTKPMPDMKDLVAMRDWKLIRLGSRLEVV